MTLYVLTLQGSGVGKLRKGAVRQVGGEEGPGTDPEQTGAERRARVGEFQHGPPLGAASRSRSDAQAPSCSRSAWR